MGANVNSAFRTTGTIREVGRVGLHGMNTHDSLRTMELGGVATFRARFPAAPSSITFNASDSSATWSGTPNLVSVDRDGFGYVHRHGCLVVRHLHGNRVRRMHAYP
jgi:hypothetical protein